MYRHSPVHHHPIFSKQDSIATVEEPEASQRSPEQSLISTESTRHAKLLSQIINPDNPFSRMTDRDMLIFNPNYHAYLKKLKYLESQKNELGEIKAAPRREDRKGKQQTALYAYAKTLAKKEKTDHDLDRKRHTLRGPFADKSQSTLAARSIINATE